MAEPTKQPTFFCPECGQKHRADLEPLRRRPGTVMRTPCRGCKVQLAVRLENGEPKVEVEGPILAKPAPDTLGGPYEGTTGDTLELGDKAGRYEIQGLTRRGHTSTVYRAHDPETKRTVALKVLGSGATEIEQDRFRRQVEVQGGIRHPNVLPVYDRGQLQDGRAFFTTEHLHDPMTLEEIAARSRKGELEGDAHLGALDSIRGLVEHVLIPIADGVYVANVENEVAHRDLRPENVVIDGGTARPYVTDFGFAASLAEGAKKPRKLALTAYIPPETAAGTLNPRTDVWGLGGLLYLLLSGEPPLAGHGKALLEHARKGQLRPLPEDADPALAAIVRKASAPDPESRYVNARQMAADLRAWLHGGAVRAVETFGDRGAHKVELMTAIKRNAKVALWAVVGLAVGLGIGSQITLRGEGGIDPCLASANTDVRRLDAEVGALADRATKLSVTEGASIYQDVSRRATDLRARLEGQEASDTRRAIANSIDFVLGRFDTHLLLDLPEGRSVQLLNTTTGAELEVASSDGPLPLAPGLYDVRGGNSLRFPLLVGLHVRRQGSQGHGPRIAVAIPTEAPPPGTVLVVGGDLESRAPFAEPGRKLRVAPFFLDRHPVSNDAYARFLNALANEARQARMPSKGFTWDEQMHVASVEAGLGNQPVRGVRPEDAEAYCAWRAEEENRPVHLPIEWQWALAAGGALVPPDARAADLVMPNAPYGAFGLRTAPSELVRAEGEPARYGAKGTTDDGDSVERILFGSNPVEASARADVTFRCARPLVGG